MTPPSDTKMPHFFTAEAKLLYDYPHLSCDALRVLLLLYSGYAHRLHYSRFGAKGAHDWLYMSELPFQQAMAELEDAGLVRCDRTTRRHPKTWLASPSAPFQPEHPSVDGHVDKEMRQRDDVIELARPLIYADEKSPSACLAFLSSTAAVRILLWFYQKARSTDGYMWSNLAWWELASEARGFRIALAPRQRLGLSEEDAQQGGGELIATGLLRVNGDIDESGHGILTLRHIVPSAEAVAPKEESHSAPPTVAAPTPSPTADTHTDLQRRLAEIETEMKVKYEQRAAIFQAADSVQAVAKLEQEYVVLAKERAHITGEPIRVPLSFSSRWEEIA